MRSNRSQDVGFLTPKQARIYVIPTGPSRTHVDSLPMANSPRTSRSLAIEAHGFEENDEDEDNLPTRLAFHCRFLTCRVEFPPVARIEREKTRPLLPLMQISCEGTWMEGDRPYRGLGT